MTDTGLLKPVRPSMGEADARLLWYPHTEIVTPRMRTRGNYADNYPRGAVVHFTAGRDQTEGQARNSVQHGRENGYAYFVIGPTGQVYQACPLDEWGYHAGESHWIGLGTGVSSKLVGIEITNAGKLSSDRKFWFGVQYRENDTRAVKADYGCPAGI
jgi:N-acetyl-anhydromuramyl-L-alanine amidase AmpD